MKKPEIPLDETQRLFALNSLKLLDTQPEERFDRITSLAQRLFGVEMSLLSLVDEDRQWFKSKVGLDAEETSREISFCGHVINQDNVMVVEDASVDVRFHDNPLVTEGPSIRFYAGCPVRAPAGEKLGTLCLIDSKPRELTIQDRDVLAELAGMIEDEMASLSVATTDELTKLANRRGFCAIAEHMIALARRLNAPMGIVNIDLDKLKIVNDTEGHQAGDRMLTGFAGLMLKNFRDADVVARFGGDEFCVLMSGASEADIKSGIERLTTASKEDPERAISFSAGIAMYDPEVHGSIEDVLHEADRRMYEVKNAKRSTGAKST